MYCNMYDPSYHPDFSAAMQAAGVVNNSMGLPVDAGMASFVLPPHHMSGMNEILTPQQIAESSKAIPLHLSRGSYPVKPQNELSVTPGGHIKVENPPQYIQKPQQLVSSESKIPFSSHPSFTTPSFTRTPDVKINEVSGTNTNSGGYPANMNNTNMDGNISNHPPGELKMTFTNHNPSIGSHSNYDTVGIKTEPGNIPDSLQERYLGFGLARFTALQQKSNSDHTVEACRSDRPMKIKSLWGAEEEKSMPVFPTFKVNPKNPDLPPDKKQKMNKKTDDQKSKSENGGKKNKLSVDDVYKSGDEGGESDGGDLSKDYLKVRMSMCEGCGKHFLDKAKLAAHKCNQPKRTAKFGSFPCEVCGYIFKRREHWRRHKLIHVDSTPYHCTICNRGFKRSEHVKRHQSVHTLEKPYECLLCDKKFTRPEHLKKHSRTHGDEFNLPKPLSMPVKVHKPKKANKTKPAVTSAGT